MSYVLSSWNFAKNGRLDAGMHTCGMQAAGGLD